VQQAFDARSNSCHIHSYVHSITHTFNTFTQAQYSVNIHEKHTHSPKRCKIGKNAGCQGRQLVVVQIKSTVSRRNRELGRQLSGILRKTNTKKIHTHTHTHIHTSVHVCMYDCVRSEGESASHSSPPQLKGVRVMCACMRVCLLTAGVHAHKSGQTKNRHDHTH
jgi:hypothetical protein